MISQRSPSRGFSLLEVLVALVVLSIGLLGVAAMQASALSSTSGSQVESVVVMEAKSLADAMVANPAYWASGTEPADFTITVSSGAPVISDSGLATTADCKTTACTAASTVAAYDVQQWAAQALTQLPTMQKTDVACVSGAPVVCTITITWTQKTAAALNSGTANANSTTTQSYQLVNQI